MVIMEDGDDCLHGATEKYRLAGLHREREAEQASKLVRERESALGDLRNALQDGDLCLFLGAGVSLSAGLPSWAELVNRLAEMAIWNDLGDKGSDEVLASSSFLTSSLPILARFVKDTLPNDEFSRRLHEILYPKTKLPRTSAFIEALIALIAGTNKVWIRDVVTYNYDDLVEQALSRLDIPFLIQTSSQKIRQGGVRISHVHGFIPELGNAGKIRNSIVLSEDDYHRMVEDAGAWSNMVQESLLRNKCCLFAGLSLQDPNLRRLLDKTKHKARLGRFVLFTPMDVIRPIERPVTKGHQTVNDAMLLNSREAYLPTYKQVIVSQALESLGVRCVWLRTRGEVTAFLGQIGEGCGDECRRTQQQARTLSSPLAWPANRSNKLRWPRQSRGVVADSGQNPGREGRVVTIAVHPDQIHLALGYGNGAIAIHNIVRNKRIEVAKAIGMGYERSISFSPDGRYMLANGNKNRVRLWDLTSGRVLDHVEDLNPADPYDFGEIWKVDFVPFDQSLAAGILDSFQARIAIADLQSGRIIKTVSIPGAFRDFVLSSDGTKLAAVSSNTVRVWGGAAYNAVIFEQSDPGCAGGKIAFSNSDGSFLYSGRGCAFVLRTSGENVTLELPEYASAWLCEAIACHPTEPIAVICSRDTSGDQAGVFLYDLRRPKKPFAVLDHRAEAAVFLARANELAVVCGDGVTRVYKSGKLSDPVWRLIRRFQESIAH
jgi:hypothetical protein